MTTTQGPVARRLPMSEDVELVEDYVIDRTTVACNAGVSGTEAHRIAAALQTAVGYLAMSLVHSLLDHEDARGPEADLLAGRIVADWNELVDIADHWRGQPGFPDDRAQRIPDGSLRDDPEFMALVREHTPSVDTDLDGLVTPETE
ncbi:hypothetical protein ACFVFS_22565 [Kitasatospora sp. NPDC057692]|uniref:hypothetical protein n=1 Tax=Kitasatospora sp. NPDC057692 TaxID=3346215 RepID=UPI0036CEA6A3